jgi:hypothetical protein
MEVHEQSELNDLPKAVLALQSAYAYLVKNERKTRNRFRCAPMGPLILGLSPKIYKAP